MMTSSLYLSELLYQHARVLRSTDQMLLGKSRGDKAFALAAPSLSNSSPVNIRTARTLEIFKSLLKTHLYVMAFNSSLAWYLDFYSTILLLSVVSLWLTLLVFVLILFNIVFLSFYSTWLIMVL